MPRAHTVDHNGDRLTIRWSDQRQDVYTALWLLDNLPTARHRPDGQKTVDIRDLPQSPRITAASVGIDGQIEVRFEPGDLVAAYSPDWLRAPAGPLALPSTVSWDSRLQATLPWADFTAVTTSSQALHDWLADIVQYGFALLRDVPTTPGRVLKVVELFGFVRHTNYGELFDVISSDEPSNLAYTPSALSLHTDNPYRDPVPTLQLLHCLTAGDDGGETVLVDGIGVANAISQASPADFDLLATEAVRFRYVDDTADLQHVSPMITLNTRGKVEAIRYNQRSLAPLELALETLPDYYRAYRRFTDMLHADSARVAFSLQPGDLVVLDNRRVLHGRRGTIRGHRHLQGCYADTDGLHSTLRCLQREPLA